MLKMKLSNLVVAIPPLMNLISGYVTDSKESTKNTLAVGERDGHSQKLGIF